MGQKRGAHAPAKPKSPPAACGRWAVGRGMLSKTIMKPFLASKGHNDKRPYWANQWNEKLIQLNFNNFPILRATKPVLGYTANKMDFRSSNLRN
jgi:hypothetical protein